MSMETGIDPRVRPSLADLARSRPPPPEPPGGGRKAFADHRISATNEVTTLGPGAEAATVDAELRFEDLVDLINPLHHLPFVGSFYRSVSGDEITAAARIMGAMIYAGPLGFVFATADSLFAEISGRPLGDTLIAAAFGDGGTDETQDLAAGENRPGPETAAPEPGASEPGPEAAAPTPAAPAPGLENQEALRALAADLRQLAAGRVGGGSPGAETIEPARPLLGAAPPPDRPAQVSDAFARKMGEALDKYRAMAEARAREETGGDEGAAAAP
ncbi:MAG: hypothetical protein QNJ67_12860 [Kiloniellales bacterium]|nr:hypothetical protein [Kiloniellales bacterium]